MRHVCHVQVLDFLGCEELQDFKGFVGGVRAGGGHDKCEDVAGGLQVRRPFLYCYWTPTTHPQWTIAGKGWCGANVSAANARSPQLQFSSAAAEENCIRVCPAETGAAAATVV